ncbi:MAG: exodeoxyribonuclease VII small subunit [Gammaproteobacteria bacterium]|nr:exodeoxyribonuclease VII small subunit [Gammaproteobacteria bacterium]MBA3730834.1 exodeoxyribonuclease VII small subunit [Gammaproteobacteria bacterium]
MARKKTPVDFEQSLTELESLVERLEQGDLTLEESLKTFERGVALTRALQAALRQAEQKIEILTTRGGHAVVEPFETDNHTDNGN